KKSQSSKVILILDGLDRLEGGSVATDLAWLPSEIETGVYFVVATPHGESLNELRRRACNELTLTPLSNPERKELIAVYLDQYRKKLDSRRVDTIAKAPQTGNPLYLCTVLDELRAHGDHSGLEDAIRELLETSGLTELYRLLSSHYQRDYVEPDASLV